MSTIIGYYIVLPWKARAGICLAYGLMMTWFSLAPASLMGRLCPDLPHIDKLAHFMMYGGLVMLARLAWPDPRSLRTPLWLLPVAALAYGLLMELMQSLLVTYHRSFEIGDIAANGLGAFLGWYLVGYAFRGGASARTDSVTGEAPAKR